MGCFNRFLLLLAFNVLNILAFGAIIAVAVINIVDHRAPTNLLIYYAYTGLLSLVLCVSELRVPRALHAQARFLFTYTGRGIVLTYFGCIVYTSKLFNVIACIYTVTLGVVYIVVAWVSVVPVHDGLLSNWSRWVHEGKHVQGVDPEHKPHSYVHDVIGAPIHGHHTSVQSIVWPSDRRPDPHESFVYGVSTHPTHVQTTGDAYLDSIVNSSRFAREVMDPVNESIVVRSSRGLAEDCGQDAERHGGSRVTISMPMAYHVFAPKSREELVENMALVNQALASDSHGSPTHRFSQ
ncbi:hypothetical protein IWW56_002219 [Coemansia sp. RSA 2131]|nr:hypothetical protein IWW56_002219 [Coemansia sp. RSA 2131]